MRLEDYFDFLSPDDIRIKGTRIGIEIVLDDYLNGATAEEIAARYRSLSLEQVYATVLYCLHHQEQVEAYLGSWRQQVEEDWREQQSHPSEFALRLRERIKRQRELIMAEGKAVYHVGAIE